MRLFSQAREPLLKKAYIIEETPKKKKKKNKDSAQGKGVFRMSRESSFKGKVYRKLREKELTKSYKNYKQKHSESSNSYPMTRLILIKDFFRTPDLYKAIAYFLSLQVIMVMITVSSQTPKYAGALNLFSMIGAILLIILSIKEINKRQHLDKTRRKVRLSHVFQTIAVMLLVLFGLSFLYTQIGWVMHEQENQQALNALFSAFPVAMFLVIVLTAPIVEELVFRELLPYAAGPSYLSFGIASLLFIVLHSPSGIVGWSSYLILAAGFLFARLRDNNIYASIIVHMVWNMLSIIMAIFSST